MLPAVWSYKKAQKKAKLLQYADHVLGIKEANDDQCATLAIEKTRSFFELMGVPTRFSAYGLDATAIPAIVEKLRQHGRLKLGEHGDITPDDVTQLLQLAL